MLHQALVFGIERAGRLIEQQHRSVTQHGARNGEALALAAGQRDAALTHAGVVALRQAPHELVGRRGHRGGAHFLVARGGAAVTDVVGDCAGEDHRLLRDHGKLGAQFVRIEARNVDAVEQDAADARIEEPDQQLKHGGFAGARRPDQRQRFARGHLQMKIQQGGVIRARRVTKGDPGKFQAAAHRLRQVQWRGRRGNHRRGREYFHQTFSGAGGALHFAPQLAQCAHRARKYHCVQYKLTELAGTHTTGQDVAGADPQHADNAGAHQYGHRGRHAGAHPGAADAAREGRLGRRAVTLLVDRFVRVGLHGGHGVRVLRSPAPRFRRCCLAPRATIRARAGPSA